MTITLFSFVDLFGRQLDTVAHLLTKASAFAAEHGIAERAMLDWRLAEDMQPLSFQVMVVITFAQSWPARAAGLPIPDPVGGGRDVAGYQAAIATTRAWLATLTPEQFAGRDQEPVTFRITDTMAPTLPAARWISGFATTNITFHASMVYAILRMKGVPLGKLDIFPGGL